MGISAVLHDLDVYFSRKIHHLSLGTLEYLIVFFGFIFNQYLIWMVPIMIYFFSKENEIAADVILSKHIPKSGILQVPIIIVMLYLCSVILTVILTQSCKIFFGRIRPTLVNSNQKFNLRKLEGNCSMPSGDSAQAANWSVFMMFNFTLAGSLSS